MKKFIMFAVSVLVATAAIFYFKWDWVTCNGDLASGFLTSIILILALFGALLTVQAMRHDHETSLAMTLSQTYESPVVFEGRGLVARIKLWEESHEIQDKRTAFLNTMLYYEMNYPDEHMKLTSIPALFDLIGWLVRRGCCEAIAIDEQLDWDVVYNRWEPYIRYKQGKKEGETLDATANAYYGNFVWLVNKLLSKRK